MSAFKVFRSLQISKSLLYGRGTVYACWNLREGWLSYTPTNVKGCNPREDSLYNHVSMQYANINIEMKEFKEDIF